MSPVDLSERRKSKIRGWILMVSPLILIIIQGVLDDAPEMWKIWSLSMGFILSVVGFLAAVAGRSQYNRRSYALYVTIIITLTLCLIPPFVVAVGVESLGEGERLGLIAGETVFLLTLAIYDYQKWRENHHSLNLDESLLISAPIQSYGATDVEGAINPGGETSDSEGNV